MSDNNGTTLYLQVEEALAEFKKGVAKLRSQQTLTDTILTQSSQALDNLLLQIARGDCLKEEVEADLRLAESFREAISQKTAEVHNQILNDLQESKSRTDKALNNLKLDLSVRRQELLGMIQELGQGLAKVDLAAREAGAENAAMEKALAEFGGRIRTLAAVQEDLGAKMVALERQNKYQLWALVALGAIALSALIW
jgi:adenylate kinase family enzyme